MKRALDLLRLATERWPPPPGRHHALTLSNLGEPHLSIHIGQRTVGFLLDQVDIEREPADLLADIGRIIVTGATIRHVADRIVTAVAAPDRDR